MRAHVIATFLGLTLAINSPRVTHTTARNSERPGAADTLRLAQIFGDGVVLQRDRPIPVWGWCAPSQAVSVTLHGHTARTTSDHSGLWKVALPREHAGGPYLMEVSGCGGQRTLHDILIGDVWIASGQSNMEFTVSSGNNAANEIASAHDSLIRQFKVPTSWANAPEADLAGGSWAPADPQHAAAFSAVAYFFARDLRKTQKIPIGIVNTTWGGSNIETWISKSAQGFSDSTWTVMMRAQEARTDSLRAALSAKLGTLPTHDAGMDNGHALWADPSLDDSGWDRIPVPAYWEDHGYPGTDGIAWYRTSFTLGDADDRANTTLTMQAIDDDDITWVNGVEIGRTQGYNVPRRYAIPASALRTGANVIVVRVADGGGGGGINGQVALMRGGASLRLDSLWKFRMSEVSFKPDGQQINKVPAVLYNKMVHPLLPFAIKGVLWYQGESNANNDEQARAYRPLFATLISSWRTEWGMHGEAFPFLWIQLPNYGARDTTPPASAGWALQRESMESALSIPHTGQVVTIDVGEAGDIHPKNKQDVGTRLSLVARKVVYGEHVLASGPRYRSHTVQHGRVRVMFNDVGGGLVCRAADGTVGGFAIAGADRRWYWAKARIVGNQVEVWSDDVRSPVAVRYAWANNPDAANLYNKEQLPAAPFRTDRW
ncbi:MAG: sialate O-acetylesterase [bacterium]